MKLLEGKTAIVTGAARGIGRKMSVRLATEGANMALIVRNINESVEELMKEIESHGVKCKSYVADASEFDRVHVVVDEIKNDFGSIDVLVNNAGITQDGLMMRMSEEQWDNVINVNLKSAFNFAHAVTPIMMRQRGGSIINMTSVVGLSGNAGQANYAASKAGMVGLTKSLAKELGARGVRVNAIAPGFIETDMTGALSDDVKTEWAKQIPLRRAGATDDVANAAVFFASDLSGYVTGQVLSVCGGMNM